MQTNKRVFGANLRQMGRQRLLLLIAFVVVALVISNYLVQRQYDRLDKQVSSIYQDRLIPSHYLFQLQSILLQKKLMLEHGEVKPDAALQAIHNYDLQMDSIIVDYEKTYLTEEESREWEQLRGLLARYNELESTIVRMEKDEVSPDLYLRFEEAFRSAQGMLASLNQLQTREGNRLKSDSQAILNSALLQSYIQISLVIVLLAIGIAILFSIPAKGDRRELYN